MNPEILVLRLVHVLGGVFWLGSGLFTAFFLMPALATAGPAAGPLMGALQRRKLFTVLPIVDLASAVAVATVVLAGAGMAVARYVA